MSSTIVVFDLVLPVWLAQEPLSLPGTLLISLKLPACVNVDAHGHCELLTESEVIDKDTLIQSSSLEGDLLLLLAAVKLHHSVLDSHSDILGDHNPLHIVPELDSVSIMLILSFICF